eukprot:2745399-Rhodomonas_salina.1
MVLGASEPDRMALVSQLFRISTHVLCPTPQSSPADDALEGPGHRPVLTIRLKEASKHFRIDVVTRAHDAFQKSGESGVNMMNGNAGDALHSTSFVDLAMHLSSVQLLVIPWADIEQDHNVLLIAKALAMQGTLFKVVFNRARNAPMELGGEGLQAMPGLVTAFPRSASEAAVLHVCEKRVSCLQCRRSALRDCRSAETCADSVPSCIQVFEIFPSLTSCFFLRGGPG